MGMILSALQPCKPAPASISAHDLFVTNAVHFAQRSNFVGPLWHPRSVRDDDLEEGLYDELISSELEQRLARALEAWDLEQQRVDLEKGSSPSVLARHVQQRVERLLAQSTPGEQIKLVNQLLLAAGLPAETVGAQPQKLRALHRRGSTFARSTVLPVGELALLTNSSDEPSVGHELAGELASANEVALLCAFIKWHGLRTLEASLKQVATRGVPFRVITSTYLGSTERKALDRLVNEFGAEVKVHYEVARTRLHAKAWLFRRRTGFHTAYVGSSNLTNVALLDGVEWNVRLTESASPTLLRKFEATFDSYWYNPAFERYDPAKDAARLDQALLEAGGGGTGRVTISLSGLEVRPYPHQRQVLEQLEVERTVHDRHRNLVVAATGTGKTVIAALDYRAISERVGRRPSLLFVAHRKEILEQALRTYREVLGDPNFGDMLLQGRHPAEWTHVFASVQSLSRGLVSQFEPTAFEVVVIDEFHHAAATSYRALLEHLEPVELLGLTATPERTDGIDVRAFFDNRVAAELRLWDALEADLLCPFHYFGINDGTDLTQVSWRSGRYDAAELENVYTGNDARTRVVLKELADKISDVSAMRALGFCSGVNHALYMARAFNEAGIPAVAVAGGTSKADREKALRDLTERRVNIVFSADLFNEGVDLPDVDTVLFLRPTESATIFLQQLGRGLRRTRDKAVLTVLDFVGHQRKEFRFDQRFSVLTGIPRGRLQKAVEEGFPHLPSGCQIVLDRHSSEAILQNLRSQITTRQSALAAALRSSTSETLAGFLEEQAISLSDVVSKTKPGWTALQRLAGRTTPGGGSNESLLLKRVAAFAHADDLERAAAYRDLLTSEPRYDELDPVMQAYARMMLMSIWPKGGWESFDAALDSLNDEASFRGEVCEVLDVVSQQLQHEPRRLSGQLGMTPLRSHARYSRDEICAALDWATLSNPPANFREGVLWSERWNADAFLITVDKDEDSYSPTTMYRDYAISRELFHWESQSRTSLASPTGQRYLHHVREGSQILLFSRITSSDDFGKGAPYLCLGTARYVTHAGEKPIAITWQLDRAMPQEHFTRAAVDAV